MRHTGLLPSESKAVLLWQCSELGSAKDSWGLPLFCRGFGVGFPQLYKNSARYSPAWSTPWIPIVPIILKLFLFFSITLINTLYLLSTYQHQAVTAHPSPLNTNCFVWSPLEREWDIWKSWPMPASSKIFMSAPEYPIELYHTDVSLLCEKGPVHHFDLNDKQHWQALQWPLQPTTPACCLEPLYSSYHQGIQDSGLQKKNIA